MELPGEDLTIVVHTAEAESASQDALNLLSSWAATADETEQADTETRTELVEPPHGAGSQQSRAYNRPFNPPRPSLGSTRPGRAR